MTRSNRSVVFRRWVAFNAVGAIGIVVQILALVLFTRLLGWNYLVATAAAVETAVLHNFIWHERWTWAERALAGRGAAGARLVRFHLANGAFSFAGNLLLMRLLAGAFGMNLIVANLVAITICSVLNFMAADHLVFTSTGRRGALILVATCACAGRPLTAAELTDGTLKAWSTYVQATEARIARERAPAARFLALDFQDPAKAAAERAALRAGAVLVTRMETIVNGPGSSVPGGMIHHWRGSVFVPGVDLAFVLARVQNPEAQEVRQEDVLRSAVLERGDGYLRLYLKLRRSQIVTVAYNTEHDVRFGRQNGARAWSTSRSVKIVELLDPGTPAEREKPQGRDHGFLWRLNSYWRYEQTAGGVIVECESLSLSRSIPGGLEFFVRPIIDRIARESMERTLSSMRDRMQRSRNQIVSATSGACAISGSPL